MPEKDPGRLPTSEMELAVTTTNGPRIYAKNPVLARRLLHLSHYCYYRNSPALALILSSLLYLLLLNQARFAPIFSDKPRTLVKKQNPRITHKLACSPTENKPNITKNKQK